MKKIILLILFISFGMISNASALSIGDGDYVGLINPGNQASLNNEADFINSLTTLAIGVGPILFDGQNYDRIGSTLDMIFPEAEDAGAFKQDNNNTSFSANGANYILGKYDGPNYGSAVWYSADGFGDVTLPADALNGQYGLSHTSAFFAGDTPNGGPGVVPEPTTMLLFGIGLIGFAGLSRRKNK